MIFTKCTRYLVPLIVLGFLLLSCNSNPQTANDAEYPIEGQTEDGFEDGNYCAEVEYYNPNTGTRSTYTLEVEVESNEVVEIIFGNGGWLDSSHMTPEQLDENGACTIISDQNYEYSVQLINGDCSSSSAVNPETDEDLPRYTFAQCVQMLNISQDEIDKYLKHFDKKEIYSESGFKIMEEYITNIREINREHERKIGEIRKSQKNLQNEINEGYIQRIEKRSMYGATTQLVTIKKRNVNYLFEVSGSQECTMGLATFDENETGWQTVYIKQSPKIDHWSGHRMRIIDSGF